jgi:serine/threonine protein kinase
VRPDGLVKVLDFGIAPQAMKRDGETRTPSNIETAPGLVMGTPRYMSPEQARGLPLDSRTDLFSLGAVLYEVLAGRPAFDGDTFSDILASVLTHDPLPLKALGPQCPLAVARIVDRALQKDVTQRCQSAEEMVFSLQAVRQRTEGRQWTLADQSGLRKSAAILTAVGTLAVFIAVLVEARLGNQPNRLPGDTESGRIRSVAVLPLEDLSRNVQQSYFLDGMTEQLITRVRTVIDQVNQSCYSMSDSAILRPLR